MANKLGLYFCWSLSTRMVMVSVFLFGSTRPCRSSWLRWPWRWSWPGWGTSDPPGKWTRAARTPTTPPSPRPSPETSPTRWPPTPSRSLEETASTANTRWRSWWGTPRSTRWGRSLHLDQNWQNTEFLLLVYCLASFVSLYFCVFIM